MLEGVVPSIFDLLQQRTHLQLLVKHEPTAAWDEKEYSKETEASQALNPVILICNWMVVKL